MEFMPIYRFYDNETGKLLWQCRLDFYANEYWKLDEWLHQNQYLVVEEKYSMAGPSYYVEKSKSYSPRKTYNFGTFY